MTTTTEHEWLRRLSDYHSGGVDAAEAAVVEEHLAGCPECREALRVYRRFYALASSPLRLGEPSSAVAEQLSITHDDFGRFMDGARLERHPDRQGNLSQERHRRLLGVASVLAASLIIVGFLAVFGARIGTRGKHTTPTPNPSATPSGPTPTVQTTNLPAPGTGYTNAGPDWATRLAFAPSSQNTVYACGIASFSSGSGGFLVAVSTDGGHTWRSQTSPGILPGKVPKVPATPPDLMLETYYQCYLSVDPNNPRDLALLGYYCTDFISENPFQCGATSSLLYRSFDGGQTWTLVNTPGGDGIAPQIVWVGSDLFVGTTLGIARSIADGPFTLLQQSYFGTSSLEADARWLFVIGNTLIVTDIQCTGNVGAISCSGPIARSVDRGAHWSLIPMTYQSNTVDLVASGADGTTLLGMSPTEALIRSTNGGATWSPLPPLPAAMIGFIGELQSAQGMISVEPIIEAPDGSIYVMLDFRGPGTGTGSAGYGIYELAPGARNWRYFAPSSGGDLQIFLWNSSGHLAAIWGKRGGLSGSGFQYRLF
jgi:Putative zinc-finger/BNR/Asp-box repeat